jgi:hypothetical protein
MQTRGAADGLTLSLVTLILRSYVSQRSYVIPLIVRFYWTLVLDVRSKWSYGGQTAIPPRDEPGGCQALREMMWTTEARRIF